MIQIPAIKLPESLKPEPALRKKIEAMSGQKVSTCFQCGKCTGGCPLTPAMDIMPHQLMHLLHLGQLEKVLASETVWICADCETCSTRCPNNIDIAHVMDTLRQITWERGGGVVKNTDLAFHTQFLKSIEQYGRMHELRLVTDFTLKTEGIRGMLKQAPLGLSMMLKGKMSLLPGRFHAKEQVQAIFNHFRKGKKA